MKRITKKSLSTYWPVEIRRDVVWGEIKVGDKLFDGCQIWEVLTVEYIP